LEWTERFSTHPKWADRISKALLSSVFGCFFLLRSKKPFGPFWMYRKTFLLFLNGPTFPFASNELKFVVLTF
jgi:hypothetical protein